MLSWPEKGRQQRRVRVAVAGSGLTRRATPIAEWARRSGADRERERERQLLDLAWSRIGERDPLATATASSPLLSSLLLLRMGQLSHKTSHIPSSSAPRLPKRAS